MDPKRPPRAAKLLFCFLMAGVAVPSPGAKRVTIQQLEQTVKSLHDRQDTDAVRQLSELQLTERLNSLLFRQIGTDLPGDQSRLVLRAIADESQFQDPPSSDTPTNPAPDVAEQRRIMGLVVKYVTNAIPRFPNFIATRTTDRFESSPQIVREGLASKPYEPLHLVDTSVATTLYRDKREVEVTDPPQDKKTAQSASNHGLSSRGEFGYILSTVLLDAAQNKLGWLRWEKGDALNLAVFAFTVPREKSHFELDYCCATNAEGDSREWQELVGYEGQMAIDPSTGAIQRIEIDAELKPGELITSARISVEYGRVDIGGVTYTCPLHSIAFSRAHALSKEKEEILQTAAHGARGLGMDAVSVGTTPDAAQQTLLNDVIFSDYHVFRSEAKILTDNASDLPPLGATTSQVASSDVGIRSSGAASSPLKNPSASASATEISRESSSAPAPVMSPQPAKSEQPEPPEITEASANPSDIPTSSSSNTAETGFRLRSTTRLVEATLVAFDKKGRPVTDLKPNDLEIYDNGQKQTISIFNRAMSEDKSQPANVTSTAGVEAGRPTFTNIQSNASTESRSSSRSATVFLVDAGNVAFGDLTRARNEMLRFLKAAEPDEPVGLYVLKRYGFQILEEPTTDHAKLAATLSKWMPSAQDLAQAQEQEQRNRQQIEYVHNISDLLSVNGNTTTGEADLSSAADPQLRSLGDNPQRVVLGILVWISRHLAAMPGHKSLIWVSSDNALADFSEKAPNEEKGDKYLDPLALKAREALNDAQISIYPLDASQLEAGGVGANTASSNVQLSPTSNVESQLAQLPPGERQEAQEALNRSQRDINPGRVTAQMQQDTHPIQSTFRELAEATGGRAFRRAGDIAAEINSAIADGRAAYLLGFTPDSSADNTYHRITVKLAERKNITLRYRTGYFYAKEPVTLRERFQEAVWQPANITEIGLSATPLNNAKPPVLKLNIAASDIGLVQQAGLWMDKIDLFVIRRDDPALRAHLDGQTLAMRLKPATYEKVLKEGISVEAPIPVEGSGTLRVIVVDENTGRIGTLTITASGLAEKR